MDNLAAKLRQDAEQIDASISPELDERIQASLHNVTQERPTPRREATRSLSFWWASSLTGVAAALAVVVIVNLRAPDPAPAVTEPVAGTLVLPSVPWNVRTAVLTTPLEQEIEDLQADLKKAEEAVKEDLDVVF